ncbi:GNAT family N-acetyltransferase [Lutimonas sp.]|uniref:GNAT family N-acetyltransferase n=1 Tax=Lutimonas sp. TaxID=1872403 RepID=UPI003D9B0AD0
MDNIIPYRPELAANFRDLNLEWLEQFFYVEAHDKELLESCQEEIIDQGGSIFFYKNKGQILGTFALIKHQEGVYELGKMAVSTEARGQGIGQEMMEFCISYSKEKKWKKLLLYSSTKLKNSIHIYEKFGFKEIQLDLQNNPYARSDIKMELIL